MSRIPHTHIQLPHSFEWTRWNAHKVAESEESHKLNWVPFLLALNRFSRWTVYLINRYCYKIMWKITKVIYGISCSTRVTENPIDWTFLGMLFFFILFFSCHKLYRSILNRHFFIKMLDNLFSFLRWPHDFARPERRMV